METRKDFERVMQEFIQNRNGRSLRDFCLDEGIDYKLVLEYKKQHSIRIPRARKSQKQKPGFIALQVVDDRESILSEKKECRWKLSLMVVVSPDGEEIELKCTDLSAAISILRKLSS